jgi:hypothetical protein
MKSIYLSLAAIGLAGCTNVETSLSIQHAAAGESQMGGVCTFEETGEMFLSEVTFDAARQNTMSLHLRVKNLLQGGTVEFGGDTPDTFTISNKVTPTRFDLRWECDVNGFADDLGELYVPQFSATEPFCLGEDTGNFVGFDVVPANGNTIEPGGDIGLVEIRPITAQLGDAFADVFVLAKLSQDCCDSAGGCSDAALAKGTACGTLQATFDRIAGQGKLNAQSFADIQKFRPFLIYDGAQNSAKPLQEFPFGYPLRLRGVLEGVTSDGTVVGSDEWWIQVNLCANCGRTPCTAG